MVSWLEIVLGTSLENFGDPNPAFSLFSAYAFDSDVVSLFGNLKKFTQTNKMKTKTDLLFFKKEKDLNNNHSVHRVWP